MSGVFPASQRVMQVTGVDNVCQRAAMVDGKKCILPKTALDGVTVALAETEWEAVF
ncbi:MAG: cobalamin biosynthesis protein [Lachnospiraceae bacterium]|nr:cobalamin biosynthesis protein [Lachnospiraceae bacterium]